jgi:hypothetical protein
MATRKLVPRADNEGGIGTALKRWASGFFTSLTVGDITFPEGGLPKFSAHKNGTNQEGIVTATFTKVTFTTEVYDIGSAYDAANSKWIPGIIGKVHIDAFILWTEAVDQTQLTIVIYVNGVGAYYSTIQASGTGTHSNLISVDIPITAITDYIEIYCYQASGSNKDVVGIITVSRFMGHMLP